MVVIKAITRRVVRHSKDTGDLRIIFPYNEMNLVGLFEGTNATITFDPHELKIIIRPQDYGELKYVIQKLREFSYSEVKRIVKEVCPDMSNKWIPLIYDTIRGNELIESFWIALLISIRNAKDKSNTIEILRNAVRMFYLRLKHIGR